MIFEAFAEVTNKRSATVVSSGGGFFGLFGATTKSGAAVTTNSALTLSAFYNGVEILCNDYAKMPKAVFQNLNGNREKRRNHPIQKLISKRPNAFMSAFMLDKMVFQYALLRGNGYLEIVRNNYSGGPESLELIDQDKTPVKVVKSGGKLFYHFDGRIVSAENMIHVPGFSFNGITGIGIVQFACNSLGVGLSTAEFAADYYKSKGQGTVIVTAAEKMDDEAKIRYGGALANHLNGTQNTKVAVVDEAKGVINLKLTPQEAEIIKTNEAVVLECARFLNIPPHKLKHLDNANYSNMESQNIQHVSDSILPWSIKFTQEYEYKLFTSKEISEGYYIKHNTGVLLQADKKTQSEYFTKLIYSGVMTRNEARKYLELNDLPGLNEPLTPVNMQTQKQIKELLEQ